MQKKDADISMEKTDDSEILKKIKKFQVEKRLAGKTANFGSRNSNQMVIILDKQPYEQQTTE